VLWYEAENAAIAKMKAAGTEIITDIDKNHRSRTPQDRSGTSTAQNMPPWSAHRGGQLGLGSAGRRVQDGIRSSHLHD